MSGNLVKPNGGGNAIARQDFGGSQMQTMAETASNAVAAQARAAVEARWIVAMKQRRDMEIVKAELLRECQRPSFAESARYLKPIGKGVEGMSIRFVEQAMQIMGNCDSEAITIYDDAEKRILEVRVTDYERNVCHRKQITVNKTIERKNLKKGETAISQRINSYGEPTYLVPATDDELLNKEAALVSKALRTCGLRLIPGWLQDEAEAQIIATNKANVIKDPAKMLEKAVAAYRRIGVQVADLESYLGHALSSVSPDELLDLRDVFNSISEGQANWADVLEHRKVTRGDVPKQEIVNVGKGIDATKAKVAAQKSKEDAAAEAIANSRSADGSDGAP